MDTYYGKSKKTDSEAGHWDPILGLRNRKQSESPWGCSTIRDSDTSSPKMQHRAARDLCMFPAPRELALLFSGWSQRKFCLPSLSLLLTPPSNPTPGS